MTKYERFVLWLNRFYHKQNKITICVLYTLIMAILGVLIYGATHQQASSNISVKYTVPTYTVTFDPNGGELSTIGGGGVSSKQITLGDAYGDLPVPTRTGYSFVGWRGRNLIYPYKYSLVDYAESFSVNGEKITLNTKANTTGSYHEGTVVINIEDLSVGKYFFSIESASYTGEQNLADIAVCGWTIENKSARVSYVDGAEPCIWYTTGKYKTIFDFDGYADGVALASGRFYIGFTTSSGASFGSASATLEKVFLTKISSENEVVHYEPYFIQRDTIFGTPGDRTLVAEWTANSNNIFTNGDFEDVYTQTDTGWDNSINGTLHATSWNDYNSGITNASTAVHAHVKDISTIDPQHGHVFEMIGAHTDYIAAFQMFDSTTKITAGTYRLSASIKGLSGQNCIAVGLHYAKTGTGYSLCDFYSSLYRMKLEGATEWIRINYEFSIAQISYSNGVYFYGNGFFADDKQPPSMNNIFYLDDVFLEKIG